MVAARMVQQANNNHLNKTTMQEINDKIQSIYSAFVMDSAKEMDGNKAAGARARKSALALNKALKDYRKASIENVKK